MDTRELILAAGAMEMSPARATETLPIAQADVANRTADREKAAAETTRLQGICDHDITMTKFFWHETNKLNAERSELESTLRDELYALTDAFALGDHVQRITKLDDDLRYLTNEYEFLVSVRMGANTLLLLDSIANLRSAEHAELVAEAALSRITTISGLAAVVDGETTISIIGGRTQALRDAADAKLREYEAAKTHAHDYRQKYEKTLAARASQGGIITGANTRGAVAKY